jgi:two-component system sensor histidine kinase FlrB
MATETSKQTDLTNLKEAFDAFSKVSGDLQVSYNGLQRQVDQLHTQLHRANKLRAAETERSRELAKRLTALLEALPGGVIMLDDDGKVREITDAAHEFLGQPLKDLEWTLVCRRAFSAGSDESGDLILRDGRKISLAQKAMKPGPGHVLLLTDVTEDRKLQEVLSRHKRLAAMGEMAAALAHQIRTPLSAGLLYLSNVVDNELTPAKRDEMLSKATQCLRDLEQLINDMLHFARGAGTGDDSIAVSDLLRTVKAAVTPLLNGRQTLEVSPVQDDACVRGNRESLAGALMNLVTNAMQHAGDDARVTIDIAAHGTDIHFTIGDNGPGVPAEFAGRIFDPFFTSRPDGTGLGLAVVRSVARAHGGDVHLMQDGLPGARFMFRLPIQPRTQLLTTKDAAA